MSLKQLFIIGNLFLFSGGTQAIDMDKPDNCPAGSKMKCNTVECLLKKQTKNGVANGIIRTIKIRGKGENGAALAIEGFDYTDCISVGSV